MIGFTVIPEGERVLVWNRRGQARIVDGPHRLALFGETVQPLVRHAAGPEEFLVVHYKDGRTEHLRGPVAAWLDPVAMEKIEVAPLTKLDGNEAIVVYRPAAAGVQRRIERGPALFMPAPDEWLHHFSWHGADPRDHRRKQPSALRFDKLRVIPDQMYYDVECVRTADDALLTVKLMVFFELVDIARMLDQTHDPIGDFINAATADVIDFAASEPFERFKEKTERLSALETYPQLTKRADTIGYRITKVVYRGYQASQTLQTMHDDAIEARTKLRLESETEQQAQDLADMKQAREAGRERERQSVEQARVAHQNQLAALAGEAKLRNAAAEQEQALRFTRLSDEQELALKTKTQEQDLAQQAAAHREQLAFLTGIAGLKVDVTRYLVAQYQHPDKIVRIDTATAAPQLHLHETGA
jgi:hypothetical protein